MNKQELIKHFEEMEYVSISQMGKKAFIDLIEQLDEPQPIKLKDIIARMEGLSGYTRSEWLDEILYKFDSDYGTLKYKDGYEQGKLEASMIPYEEPQKVVVSEEEAKFLETFDFNYESDVTTALYYVSRAGWGYYLKNNDGIDLKDLTERMKLEDRKRLIKAILDGYTVEKEKRYRVRIKGVYYNGCLIFDKINKKWFLSSIFEIDHQMGSHTRKELEDAGFGEVFDSPLFEVEEVE